MNTPLTLALAVMADQRQVVQGMVEEAHAAQGSSQSLLAITEATQSGAQAAHRCSQDGLKLARQADATVALLLGQLEGIDRKQQQIHHIADQTQGLVEALEDISAKAHIIAINAAIESSRSQESSSAFGVLSKEFQKLSEQSQGITQQAQGLLGLLGGEVQALSHHLGEGTQLARRGREEVALARQAFDAIAAEVEALVAQSLASGEEAQRIGHLGDRLPQLAAMVAKNRAIIEEGLAYGASQAQA